jgi:hypothetical protein
MKFGVGEVSAPFLWSSGKDIFDRVILFSLIKINYV